ncbi:MAG TPA: SPOR domain-containing protein [Thermoanaerobaculia bacterium]|nr:SPOR domain-containing protein [Thermoanaerobaculia bacterium]
MSEPPTHYQVSFTGKQALTLFVGLLAALGLSYFFGLMTGLAGNETPAVPGAPAPEVAANAAETPASAPRGTGDEAGMAFPIPVTAAPSAGGPAPAPARTIHLFEDGEGGAPAPAPARAATPRRLPAASGGFRIQVLSVSSRADAEADSARLSRQGFPARVEPGTGPRGTVYRVRVGPYGTRQEAEEASRRLASQGRRDTWIVPPGQ